MSTVIHVENLSKKYIISHQKQENYLTLRDAIMKTVTRIGKQITKPFYKANNSQFKTSEEFWALKEISFTVEQGDRLGIIGRNGAGKSTLLKILSRITEPTLGQYRIKGRVASLLEVGTGFHPELTGRENIYLNGAILGMSRGEIKKKFDEIVAFSEVETFLDTPVKRYSSGMSVRLAFAVAAHLEAEILLIDEVLAVGDTEFQKKCLGKMEQVGREGKTVVFISHNLGTIRQLCNKGILISGGKIVSNGSIQKVISDYIKSFKQEYNQKCNQELFHGELRDSVTIKEVLVNSETAKVMQILPSSEIRIAVRGFNSKDIPNFKTIVSIYKDDIRLFTCHDSLLPEFLPRGFFEAEVVIPPYFLRPGKYSIAVGGLLEEQEIKWIYGEYIRSFMVLEEWDDINQLYNIGIINMPQIGKRLTKGE